MAATGKVVQVLGNVVDVEFTAETLPKINDALTVRVNEDAQAGSNGHASSGSSSGIELGGTAMQARDLVLEVQDELGNNQVRCLALGSTDGLRRGDAVTNTGGPIKVPVGEGTLGRIFNVLGPDDRFERADQGRGVLADPSACARFQIAGSDAETVRDRDQSHRLDGAVHARR